VIKTCNLVLKQCLPCNDDPIRNITAEAPDVDVFIGYRDYKWNPPLGVTYFQLSCKTICFSAVSQEQANLCALRDAQDCDWNGGEPPGPPTPPGPGGGGSGGGTDLPPSNPRNPIARYPNRAQTCDAFCPDGSSYTSTIPAGTVTELSQALADEKAKSMACALAQQNIFCISAGPTPSVCVGESYFYLITTNIAEGLIWSIEGDLPPGLDFNFDGSISGTPTTGGSYTFVVEVTDSLGRIQSKALTICIMEIVTAATLPDASIGLVYAQALIQQAATVSSEVWTLVSGSLPDGILLAASGSLTGIPTTTGTSVFTLQVDATCDGKAVSCQKTFSLEVQSSVDCMGSPNSIGGAVWTQISDPLAGTITIVGGDGTFQDAGANSPFVEAQSSICNPHTDPYDFTVDIAWTVGGCGFPLLLTSVTFTLNGVDNTSPVHNSPGGYTFHFAGSLPSGVNSFRIYCQATGLCAQTMTGTVTIRPLTPP